MTSHQSPIVIGVDLGTSSVKALATDERGHTLGVETSSYPTLRPRPDWAEQRPDDWWTATVIALRRLTSHPELANANIFALSLSGQMHGAVILDSHESPLRDALIWADSRGGHELNVLAARVGGQPFAQVTGSAPYASATLAKLLWLRTHEPEIFACTAHVLLAKDEMRRRLTGTLATDPSDASGTQLYDIVARTWSAEVLEAAELDQSLLPQIVPSDAIAARLSRSAADATGLPSGLPVVTGGGDAACAALGAGISDSDTSPFSGLLSLGTAGQLAVLSHAPTLDPAARAQTLCAVNAGAWLTMAAILDGGFAMQWLASVTGARDTAVLLAEGATVPTGSDGLIFVPYLSGTRTPHLDPSARGMFIGLSAAHERRHLARAVVEGVALAFRECLDVLRELELCPEALVCIGGPAGDPFWQSTLASVLRLPLDVSHQRHASAVGAAMLGLRAIGIVPEFSGRTVGEAQRVMPDSRAADHYDTLYETYLSIYPAMRSTMHRLVAKDSGGHKE